MRTYWLPLAAKGTVELQGAVLEERLKRAAEEQKYELVTFTDQSTAGKEGFDYKVEHTYLCMFAQRHSLVGRLLDAISWKKIVLITPKPDHDRAYRDIGFWGWEGEARFLTKKDGSKELSLQQKKENKRAVREAAYRLVQRLYAQQKQS